MAAIVDAGDALARMTQLMENAPPPRLSKEDKEMKRPTREWLDSMYGAAKKKEESTEPSWVADHVAKNEALRKAIEEKEEMTLVEGDRPYEDEPPTTPLLADDRDVVLKAVRQDGFALARAPASFRADEEIVRAAVGQAPRALKYASDELRANRELVLECVKREGLALHGACAELGTDPEVVEAAMAQIAEAALRAEAEEEEELRQCPVAPFYPEGRDHTTYKWRTERLPSDPTFELPAEVAGDLHGKKAPPRPAAAED